MVIMRHFAKHLQSIFPQQTLLTFDRVVAKCEQNFNERGN